MPNKNIHFRKNSESRGAIKLWRYVALFFVWTNNFLPTMRRAIKTGGKTHTLTNTAVQQGTLGKLETTSLLVFQQQPLNYKHSATCLRTKWATSWRTSSKKKNELFLLKMYYSIHFRFFQTRFLTLVMFYFCSNLNRGLNILIFKNLSNHRRYNHNINHIVYCRKNTIIYLNTRTIT